MTEARRDVTARFERTYRALLDEAKRCLPDVRLILCAPFAFLSPRAAENEEVARGDRLRCDKTRRLAAITRRLRKSMARSMCRLTKRLHPMSRARQSAISCGMASTRPMSGMRCSHAHGMTWWLAVAFYPKPKTRMSPTKRWLCRGHFASHLWYLPPEEIWPAR